MKNDTKKAAVAEKSVNVPATTKPAARGKSTAAAKQAPASAPVAQAKSVSAPAEKPAKAAVQRSQTAGSNKSVPAAKVGKPPVPADAAVPAKPVKAEKPSKAKKAERVEKAEKAEKPAKADKPAKTEKPRKAKLVRDSFTMPAGEYARIAELKARLSGKGLAAKKSEILRAGVALLAALDDAALAAALQQVEVVKTGRPAKEAK